MKKLSQIIIIILLNSTYNIVYCQDKLLKLHLNQNDSFKYHQEVNLNLTHKFKEGNDQSIQNLNLWLTIVVTSVSDSNATLKLIYPKVKIEYSTKTQNYTYDSDIDSIIPKIEVLRPYASLTGCELSLTIDLLGNIQKIDDLNKTQKKILENLDANNLKHNEALMEHYVNEKIVRSYFSELFPVFPTKKIARNEPWSRSNVGFNTIPLIFNNELKITKFGKLEDCIEVQSKIKSPERGMVKNRGSLNVVMNLKGTGIGQIILNSNNGMVQHSESTQTVSGTLSTVLNGIFHKWPIELVNHISIQKL